MEDIVTYKRVTKEERRLIYRWRQEGYGQSQGQAFYLRGKTSSWLFNEDIRSRRAEILDRFF